MTGAVGRAFPNCQRDRLAETPRFRRLSFRQDPDAHLRGVPDSHLHRFGRSRYPVGAVKHRDGLFPHDLDGKNFDLSSLRGKYVVLDFWGSWCGSVSYTHLDVYKRQLLPMVRWELLLSVLEPVK